MFLFNIFSIYNLPHLFTSLICISFLVIIYHKKLLNSRQWLIFIAFYLFWSANIVIRAYRKSYAFNSLADGGLDLGLIAAANIAAAYGLSSLFSRYGVFYFSDRLKTRKGLLLAALVLLALSNIFVLILPSYLSLYINSLIMGLNASMLMLFNLLFLEESKEGELDKEKIIKSISLLSIAPLFAEFSMSSFQAHFTVKGEENYPVLWFISTLLVVLATIFIYFIPEYRSSQRKMNFANAYSCLRTLPVWLFGFLGILLSFIKFATSGSNIITYFQNNEIGMHSYGIAYSDFLFSLAQLVSGFLMGYFFAKRLGIVGTLSLGIALSMLYQIILLLTYNGTILFLAQILAGFAYGLAYNVLLAWALTDKDKELRDMNSAIYQTFFAIGIFFGDKIYGIIFSLLKNSLPSTFFVYHYVFFLTLFVSIFCLILILLIKYSSKKDKYAIIK